MKNRKIYKGLLLLGTTSSVLVSCGKVSEPEYITEYDSQKETSSNNDVYLNENISIEDNKSDECIIRVYDEFGNDVTDTYNNKESETDKNSVVEDATVDNEQASQENESETSTDSNVENNQENTSDNIELTNDEVIINYFSEKKNDLSNTSDLTEFKEKAVNLFITTIDFIFYDTEIYGIKYNDLKDETKKTILNDFAEIDSIISSKYPTYKEDVQAKYDKAAYWTVESYNTVINYIKSGLSDESLNSIDKLKANLKDTAESLKDTTSNIYQDQKVKVKTWYEQFKNNH